MNNLMTKSFQNYVDLKKQALEEEICNNGTPDLETGRLTDAEEDNLSLFFREVETITADVDGISNLLLDLRRLNQDSKSTHSPKLLRGISDQIESDMVAVLRKANAVKHRLKLLDDSNAANRQISPVFGEGSAVDRARIFITSGVRIKLSGIMNEFQELRERIVADHKEGLRRRFFVSKGELPSDEVLDGIISGGGRLEMALGGRQNELGLEAEERRRAVAEIRRSLDRLQMIFLDMAVVVEKQGEELNDIAGNVACARSFVSGGTGQLSGALVNRRKRRRGVILCICTAAAAAAVLIVFLVLLLR